MVSRNKLLGSGISFEEEEEKPKVKPKVEFLDFPMWIYNLDFPRGKIIKTKQELKDLGENYVDSPKKVHTLAVKPTIKPVVKSALQPDTSAFSFSDFEESDIESEIDLSEKRKKDKKG